MMRHTFPNVLPLKILVSIGASLLITSAPIVFGLIDESVINQTGDEKLATKIVYTTGGFGFVVMILAGMYYFQYKYRL
jgi:hypothetical protein